MYRGEMYHSVMYHGVLHHSVFLSAFVRTEAIDLTKKMMPIREWGDGPAVAVREWGDPATVGSAREDREIRSHCAGVAAGM